MQNAHAYVNAAFSVVSDSEGMVLEARFVFGGLGYHMVCLYIFTLLCVRPTVGVFVSLTVNTADKSCENGRFRERKDDGVLQGNCIYVYPYSFCDTARTWCVY